MLFIRWLHYLTGYVLFTASGGFPERFVNLCAGMRIPVWDVCPCGEALVGKTRPSAYLRLRTAAKRAGMRLRITDKRGVPFVLHRYRARSGLLIGAALFVLLPAVLSTRLWVIEIEGNNLLTADAVRAALYDAGITEGMPTKAIRPAETERLLQQKLPRVSWIALVPDGSVLHVTLRENNVPGSAEPLPPCHIVASRDGFLVRLETYEGRQIARERTAVRQGELLISGLKDHLDGSATIHHADGYAVAQTTRTIRVLLSGDRFPTAQKKRFRTALHLFGIYLPLGDPKPVQNTVFFSYETFVTAAGNRLPLSYVVYRSTFFGAERRLTDAQRRLLLQSDFGQRAAMQLRGCTVQSARLETDARACTGTFSVLENIGVEEPILLEDTSYSASSGSGTYSSRSPG